MLILFFFFVASLNVLAHTNIGLSMNTSRLQNSVVQDTNFPHEQKFEKNSMVVYGQSSFMKDTLFLTAKTEVINIARNEFKVNTKTFPRTQSQGIRSMEFLISYYFYNIMSWRFHGNGGYNSKGFEQNNNIKFAFAHPEYVIGMTVSRAKKIRGAVITPIILGMLDIDKPYQYFSSSTYQHTSKEYTAISNSMLYLQPAIKNISFKLLATNKTYTFHSDAVRKFANEEKLTAGLIFYGSRGHSLDFSIYHDTKIKEFGTSLGYYYYFKHNKHNPLSRHTTNLEQKYTNKCTKKNKKDCNTKWSTNKISKRELRMMVREILEDDGY